MDCLQIDWGNVMTDGTFERDEFYESIQAPKWIDFTAPLAPVDDEEWFCGTASGCIHGKKSFVIPTHDDVVTDVLIENSASATRKRGPRSLLVSTSLSSLSEVTANVHKSMHPFPPIPESKTLESKMKRPIHQQQQIASENVNPNQAKVTKKPSKTNSKSTTNKETKVSDIDNDTIGKESRMHASRMSRDLRNFNNKIGINSEKEATVVAITKTMARKKDGIVVEPCKTQTPKKQQQALGVIQYLNRSKNVDEGGGSSLSTQPVARNHHLMASLSMPLNKSIKSLHSDCAHNKDQEIATRTMAAKLGTKPKQCKSVGDGDKEDTLDSLVGNESIKNEVDNRHISVLMMENARKSRLMKTLEDDKGSEVNSCRYIQEALSKRPHVLGEALIDPMTVVFPSKSSIRWEENEGVCMQEIHLITSQPSQEEVMKKPRACSYQCNQTTTNANSIESNLEELFLNNLSLNEYTSLHCDNTFEQQNLKQQYLSIHAQQEDMDEAESMRCSSQSGLSSCEIMSSKLITNPSHPPYHQDGNCEVSLARSISTKETISIQSSIKESETKQSSTIDWQTSCGSKRRKNSEMDSKVNCNTITHKYQKHEVQKVHKNRSFTNYPSSLNSQTKKTTTASNTLIKPFRLRTEERGGGSGRKKGFVRRSNTEFLATQKLVEKTLRIQSSAHQLFRPQRSTKKLTIPREPKFHQSARSRRECIASADTKHSSSCEK